MMNLTDQYENLPPHDLEAEMAVLASSILDRDAYGDCKAILTTDSFFQADHQAIWRVIADLREDRSPVDIVSLRAELKKRKLHDDVGGDAYLGAILNSVPSAAHGFHYAKIVSECAKRRGIIAACNIAVTECFAPRRSANPSDEVYARLSKKLSDVMQTGRLDTIRPLEAVLHEVMEEMESSAVMRLRIGLTDLDRTTGGIPIGLNTLIAGKAGMGKSILCKQFAINMARGQGGLEKVVDAFGDEHVRHVPAQAGVAVGIITIEENNQKIAKNYLSGESGLPNHRMAYNQITREEWPQLMDAVGRLARLPIFLDDAQQRISDIERVARRMATKHGVKAIIVDHLHLIDGETDAVREQEISKISARLKGLWKELNVAGVIAVQMNRGGNADRSAPPELDQMRGSGSLEQDGDLIIQVFREDYVFWKQDGYQPNHRLDCYVNKNKDGPVGLAHAYFDGDYQMITDWNDGRGPYEGRAA